MASPKSPLTPLGGIKLGNLPNPSEGGAQIPFSNEKGLDGLKS
jgi:hypothetical protein